MKKYKVSYDGGESKKFPGMAVDYMQVEVDGTLLYEESNDIDYAYDLLRDSIVKQAKSIGLKEYQLIFH